LNSAILIISEKAAADVRIIVSEKAPADVRIARYI